MNIIMPEKVHHKDYGNGEVLRITSDKIYVSFGGAQRIFDYPDAFDKGFLSADVEIESSKELSIVDIVKPAQDDNKKTKKKLSQPETTETFESLAKKYTVLDHSRLFGGHDRFYLGKEGRDKSMFLACSRVGWMCVYFDWNEKVFLESNGFICEPANPKRDKYDYKTHIDVEDFDAFLELVQKHLDR